MTNLLLLASNLLTALLWWREWERGRILEEHVVAVSAENQQLRDQLRERDAK